MPVRTILAVLLAVAAVAVFVATYVQLWPFLIDDVFISARYARHLVEGHGLVWIVGERVEGYTNFLWTVLLAPGFIPALGLVPWIKWMNAAWAMLAFALTWRLAVRFAARDEAAREPGPALWGVMPAAAALCALPFVLSAAEGLETMMFTALAQLALLWAWDARESERWPRAALALAALAMTRPDGVLNVVWIAVVLRLRGRSWAHVARTAGVFALIFGAYFITRWAWYGELLPNTFYAKGGGHGELMRRGLQEIGAFAGRTGGWTWLVAIPALFARRWRPAAIAVLGMPLLRGAFELWSGGAWMGRDRFLVPALPHIMLLVALGARALVRRAPEAAAAVALAFVLASGWATWPAAHVRAVTYGQKLQQAHLRFGLDVDLHTAKDAVIAIDDAGIAPLVADREAIDMLGLNDGHLAHLPGVFAEKFDNAYVLSRRPDLVVLLADPLPDARPRYRLAGHAAMIQEPAFGDSFVYSREYLYEWGYHLLVYRRAVGARVDTIFWTRGANGI